MDDIKHKAVHAFFWKFLEKISLQGCQFIISIILARILSPSDYGLIGMLTVFIAISNIIIESGFVKALIQKKDCTEVDYSTAFIINFVLSSAIYGILFISAPFIADFYNEPILCDLLRILSINIVIASLNISQRAKLMKTIDFKSLTKINFTGTVCGGVIGIIMAYSGFGVWALVGQYITNTTVAFFLFPLFSKWRPSFRFSKESFKKLFGFGSNILIISVVDMIIRNISTICIGKFYKSSQLGYFTRARQFTDIIIGSLGDVVNSVTFPVLSECQSDEKRMKHVYKKSLFYTAAFIFPFMVTLSLLSEPLISLLLTDKWLPCVPLMQIMCFTTMMYPIIGLNSNLVNATGHSEWYRNLNLISTPLSLLMLAITIPIGVKAIVIGELVLINISFLINGYFPKKILGYGAIEELLDWKYIIISLLIEAFFINLFLTNVSDRWLQLLGGSVIAVITYSVSMMYIFKAIKLKEIKSLFK